MKRFGGISASFNPGKGYVEEVEASRKRVKREYAERKGALTGRPLLSRGARLEALQGGDQQAHAGRSLVHRICLPLERHMLSWLEGTKSRAIIDKYDGLVLNMHNHIQATITVDIAKPPGYRNQVVARA